MTKPTTDEHHPSDMPRIPDPAEATPAPITFPPNDLEALRTYVAGEVERVGGLSPVIVMHLLEMGHDETLLDEVVDIVDGVPRLDPARSR